jgi:hypothetical protein
MIKYPSYTSAIITGAIGMPLFVFVLNYLDYLASTVSYPDPLSSQEIKIDPKTKDR